MKISLCIGLSAAITVLAPVLAAFGGPADVPCEVQVITVPDKASLFFDKTPKGSTPAVVQAMAGEHLLVVRKDGFEEFRKTIVVEPGQSRMLAEFRLEPVRGLVVIVTEPAGADITIDKAQRGRSPVLVTDLLIGKYKVVADMRGYFRTEKDLVIEDSVPQKLEISLKSNFGSLSIESEPSGADVSVNGVPKGQTPCKVTGLAAGELDVALSIASYRQYRQKAQVRVGEDTPVKVKLDPLPGSLVVNSTPQGAMVYVDNQRKGKTPLTIEDLAIGEHRVRVEADGYEPLARTVTIRQAERISEDFGPEKTSGTMEILTRPAGVRVYIDGQDKGVTAVESGKSDAISMPLTIPLVPEGSRTIQLSKKGYEPQKLTVDVQRNSTATLNPVLKRIFVVDTVVKTGTRAEDSYAGFMVERYSNGDIKLELKPGVFRVFQNDDIKSVEPYKTSNTAPDQNEIPAAP